MKIKLIIDFNNKESLEIVNYFVEYKKMNDLDLEIYGYDLNKIEKINKAYYGLYYSNKFGVGIEFTKCILDNYHNNNKDIGDLKILADCYEEIGFDRNDFIDAMMDGDYVEMHEYYQLHHNNNDVTNPCTAFIYDENKHVVSNANNIIKYVDKYKN